MKLNKQIIFEDEIEQENDKLVTLTTKFANFLLSLIEWPHWTKILNLKDDIVIILFLYY